MPRQVVTRCAFCPHDRTGFVCGGFNGVFGVAAAVLLWSEQAFWYIDATGKHRARAATRCPGFKPVASEARPPLPGEQKAP